VNSKLGAEHCRTDTTDTVVTGLLQQQRDPSAMTEPSVRLPLNEHSPFRVGRWLVDPILKQISCDAEVVKIDPRNMRVLLLLASRANEIVTQAEIEESVWAGLVVTPNSVYQSIAQLRRAFRQEGDATPYIETVSRKGYRLIAPLMQAQAVEVDTVSASTQAASSDVDAVAMESATETASFVPRRRFRASHAITTAIVVVIAASVWLIKSPPPETTSNVEALSPEIAELLRGDLSYRKAVESNSALADRLAAATSENDMSVVAPLTSVANLQLLTSNPIAGEATARRVLAVLDLHEQRLSEEAIEPLKHLARALIDLERYREAETRLQDALTLATRIHDPLHDSVIWTYHDFALLRLAEGRYEDAEVEARKALQLYIDQPRAMGTRAMQLRHALILALNGQGKYEAAISESEAAFDSIQTDDPPAPYFVAMGYHVLGESLIGAAHYADAVAALNKAIEMYESIPHRIADKVSAQINLAIALNALGKTEDALTIFKEAERTMTYVGDGWRERSIRQTINRLSNRIGHAVLDTQN
jgi:DNA-binding winged helix-turn-helix (wHTH) protein/tetratricopeptide (TPR) repeat protein